MLVMIHAEVDGAYKGGFWGAKPPRGAQRAQVGRGVRGEGRSPSPPTTKQISISETIVGKVTAIGRYLAESYRESSEPKM